MSGLLTLVRHSLRRSRGFFRGKRGRPPAQKEALLPEHIRAIKAEVPEEEYTVPIGVAAVTREGTDVTIVAWAAMVREAMKAAEELEAEGISAEVIDLRTLSPMDSDTVVNSVRKTGRLVVTHEAPRTLGLGAEVAARVCEEAFTSLLAPVERVTGYDAVMPLFKLEDYYLPNAAKIVAGVRKVMNY